MKSAKKIVDENRSLFESLEEFDRTGKLRKASYKERVNFTVNERIMFRFRKYCKEKGFAMSKKVEFMIKKELEKNS